MKNNFLKIAVVLLPFCLFAACASVGGVFKKNRPFEPRSFDAAGWRAGDAQTRGEMSQDLQWKKDERNNYIFNRQSRRQILELLGEPDRKTRGRCCGAGGTSEEEVWLYDLEVPAGTQLKPAHFQIYFHPSDIVDEWRVMPWDETNPDYFPRVG